jgi:hypothetical protein
MLKKDEDNNSLFVSPVPNTEAGTYYICSINAN